AVHRLRRRRPDRRSADDGAGAARRAAGDRPVRLQAGLLAARATGAAARLAGRGGTSLPGKVLMRAEPHAIAQLAARLPQGSVVVSATNGKTTTAAMIAAILGRTGTRLVHNRAGANMAGGVAAALAAARGELGLFEVDEFWLGPVAAELSPRAVPLVADLGRHREALYFGVEDDALALPEMQHASDSKHCRRCGHAYVYEAAYLAHLGHYECPHCGARRPDPQVTGADVQL